MRQCRYNVLSCDVKDNFEKKNPVLPIEEFPAVSCISQEYDNVTTP